MSDGLKVLLGVLAGATVVLLFVSRPGGGGMMGGSLLGMLFALLFWVPVITLIVALVVWIVNQTQRRWALRCPEDENMPFADLCPTLVSRPTNVLLPGWYELERNGHQIGSGRPRIA